MSSSVNVAVIAQQLINALAVGSVYAMIAVGLAMIYGVLRIIHIAHAAIYTAGAYIGLCLYSWTGNLLASAAGAMVLGGLAGMLIERFIYRPILSQPRIVALVASIGLFIFLSDLFRIVAGPDQIAFDVKSVSGIVSIDGITLPRIDFLIVSGTLGMLVALWAILRHTPLGFAIRATAQNIETAQMVGIDTNRSIQSVFFIGSAIAAFGGVMVGILYSAVYPTLGDAVGYKGLALIVIGGFGSMTGAVLAAFLLGIGETALMTYSNVPLSRDGMAMLMLVILVLLRPQGLFGKR